MILIKNTLIFVSLLLLQTSPLAAKHQHNIYVIRHGQTAWNKQGRVQGHTDIPLNQEGEKQAIQLRKKLASVNFSKVFSSDLSRAYRTAELVVDPKTVEIIQVPDLRERGMGIWEGRLMSELKTYLNNDILNSLLKDEYLSYKWDESIESYADVYRRIQNFITSVTSSSIDGPVLLASHGGVLRAILYHFDFQSGLRWQVENGAYLKLQISYDGQISIVEAHRTKLVPVKDATISF